MTVLGTTRRGSVAEVASETLTFLFTDLEGSTRLWEEHPAAMRTALAHHDGLVRDAVEGHGGQVVKNTGDGALATFRGVRDGIGAAVAAQGALCAAWPDELELRVRMGLHAALAGVPVGAEIDAARARLATMSYDDAVAFVFDAMDRLIAEHGSAGTAG
jgi:class 3 adenylate cyclase